MLTPSKFLAENNTVIMLMLSRLTLDSRKTSLKGISQIEFIQLIGLPTCKTNGTRKDRKKKTNSYEVESILSVLF